MLMTRRKRKERGEVEVYLNNKLLRQVNHEILGIIIDKKLTFREHISQATEKCRKLIFTLARSANLNSFLSHKALKTLYTGGIQSLLVYGAPVWAETVEKARYSKMLKGVQRLINIKIAKAYRRVSNEALRIIRGLKPIQIKIKETAELYKIVKGKSYINLKIDHDKLPKQWLHPADRAFIIDEDKTQVGPTHINIYTDGSKPEQGVGAGIAIIRPETTTVELMYKMDTRCTNNQAEAFAKLKSLEYVQTNLNTT